MKKYRLTLTAEELVALRDRLVPITPTAYDLHTYGLLRGLYGRLDHLIIRDSIDPAVNRLSH